MKKTIFDIGIKLSEIKPEVGKTYPVFGVLSDLNFEDSRLVATINDNIKAELIVNDENQIKTLLSRIFDNGIFFVEIKEVCEDGSIRGFCSTIIFG
ncbi:MAG: hypothetical protein NZO16_03150, partial [Deltaproteobacteria bacterium]|nr:hypothetical protein [Deltaproteobacteria bacterium]